MKRAQLTNFEASAKIFRTPTCPTAMRVWTLGRIEKQKMGLTFSFWISRCDYLSLVDKRRHDIIHWRMPVSV